MRSHRAGLIFLLGIIGLFGCFPCAPVAWVLGNSDLTQMQAGAMDPAGKQLTNLGRILGMVSTILVLVFLLGAIVVRLFA